MFPNLPPRASRLAISEEANLALNFSSQLSLPPRHIWTLLSSPSSRSIAVGNGEKGEPRVRALGSHPVIRASPLARSVEPLPLSGGPHQKQFLSSDLLRYTRLQNVGATIRRRRAFSLASHGSDLQLIAFLSPSTKNRVGRQFQHAVRLQADRRDSEWADVLFDVNHALLAVKKNQVEREEHADGVHTV